MTIMTGARREAGREIKEKIITVEVVWRMLVVETVHREGQLDTEMVAERGIEEAEEGGHTETTGRGQMIEAEATIETETENVINQTEIKITRADLLVEIAIETGLETEIAETTIKIEITVNERETGTMTTKRQKAARETEIREKETERREKGMAIVDGGEGMKIEERGVVPVAAEEEGREGKEVGVLEGEAEDTATERVMIEVDHEGEGGKEMERARTAGDSQQATLGQRGDPAY